MRFLPSGISAVVLLFCCAFTAAASSPLVISDYPQARVVFASQKNVSDYVLALGSYKKVRGLWRVDEQRLSGELERKTYELPDNHSARDGYNFFYQQLQKYPLRELFTCQSRECGESNTWANIHFGVLQLYGLDQHQYYGVFEITAPEYAGVYVTVYSVLRGNKRVYVQLEVLSSDESNRFQAVSNPATLVKQLQRDGFTVFAGLRYGAGESLSLVPAHVKALAQALVAQPQLRLALVGHNYAPQPLEKQREQSLGYAEQLKRALVAQGVDEKRLEVYGMGGLAPAGRGDAEARVDVVLLR
ncbi:DUF4892 domain-containing protein [Gilvimarinus sp. DA14]|uniref:DUF4892 domain-containing protein n=1 Tax=Gilvimarinus sp. DA14 TaxID=2956798 RepID=UPI0020B7143D|nr:DUF4892 domain-containing protein [Gilvimarinus sp. DA14]UTF61003.1 DUF4892 domain-containing protein [Gilvimarinus sp. DA14]